MFVLALRSNMTSMHGIAAHVGVLLLGSHTLIVMTLNYHRAPIKAHMKFSTHAACCMLLQDGNLCAMLCVPLRWAA